MAGIHGRNGRFIAGSRQAPERDLTSSPELQAPPQPPPLDLEENPYSPRPLGGRETNSQVNLDAEAAAGEIPGFGRASN